MLAMQRPAPLRRLGSLLLACCLVSLLPACVKIERIDTNGNPVNKLKPVVGTHVGPSARR
jgi:hypothetical protein